MHPFIKPLTAAILILVLLPAGCTDTGDGSGNDPTPVGTETPVHTPEPTPKIDSTPEVDPTSKPIDEITEWMLDNPTYHYTELSSENNLFNINIEMYANEKQIATGTYSGFDEYGNKVFRHEETTEIKYYVFSDDQYEKLTGKYDLDKIVYERNLETGKVALQIDDNAPVIMDADDGWDNVSHYIKKAIHLGLI